jgi:hypothetical protein
MKRELQVTAAMCQVPPEELSEGEGPCCSPLSLRSPLGLLPGSPFRILEHLQGIVLVLVLVLAHSPRGRAEQSRAKRATDQRQQHCVTSTTTTTATTATSSFYPIFSSSNIAFFTAFIVIVLLVRCWHGDEHELRFDWHLCSLQRPARRHPPPLDARTR